MSYMQTKKRHKKEREEKELNIKTQKNLNNKKNENNGNLQEISNLNINLITRDNNDDINLEKDDINIDKNINYTEINDSAKSKKRNSDGYKEEDIVSKIAITEFSADKNDTFDTFSIRENSNLNIINDDVLK